MTSTAEPSSFADTAAASWPSAHSSCAARARSSWRCWSRTGSRDKVIGRLLLDALCEHARSAGATPLEMTALTGNTRMIRLFHHARFAPADAGTVTGLLPVAA